MVDAEAGYVQRDGLLLACEIVDCQPWFDFADLEVFVSDSEAESLSTDPEEVMDSDDSEALTPEEEDTFRFAPRPSVYCTAYGCLVVFPFKFQGETSLPTLATTWWVLQTHPTHVFSRARSAISDHATIFQRKIHSLNFPFWCCNAIAYMTTGPVFEGDVAARAPMSTCFMPHLL